MSDKFVVKPRGEDHKVVMSVRINRDLQVAFDKLAAQSDRSRNELMGMALRYALEHLEFIPEQPQETNP